MLKSFQIKNFRCFRDLKIDNPNRINLFAGKNNVGKTALLEAIFTFLGPNTPDLIFRINAMRGFELIKVEPSKTEQELPWTSLFYNFDTSNELFLSGELNSIERKLHITTQLYSEDYQNITIMNLSKPNGSIKYPTLKMETFEDNSKHKSYLVLSPVGPQIVPFPPPPPACIAVFLGSRVRAQISEDVERFSSLKKIKRESVVIESLKVIEPELKELTILTHCGLPMLHGVLESGRIIPLPLMGEGMVKITSLILAIAFAKDGVVLIDEVENGLHYTVMSDLWRALAKASREFNCQIFATTHSYECIKSAFHALHKDEPFDFYRLEKEEDKIRAIHYDKDMLEASFEMELELR